MRTQLAAKEAAAAELEKLADAAAQSAQQVAALRSELALKTQQLAEQQRLLAQYHDKVRRNAQSQCPQHLMAGSEPQGAMHARHLPLALDKSWSRETGDDSQLAVSLQQLAVLPPSCSAVSVELVCCRERLTESLGIGQGDMVEAIRAEVRGRAGGEGGGGRGPAAGARPPPRQHQPTRSSRRRSRRAPLPLHLLPSLWRQPHGTLVMLRACYFSWPCPQALCLLRAVQHFRFQGRNRPGSSGRFHP